MSIKENQDSAFVLNSLNGILLYKKVTILCICGQWLLIWLIVIHRGMKWSTIWTGNLFILFFDIRQNIRSNLGNIWTTCVWSWFSTRRKSVAFTIIFIVKWTKGLGRIGKLNWIEHIKYRCRRKKWKFLVLFVILWADDTVILAESPDQL